MKNAAPRVLPTPRITENELLVNVLDTARTFAWTSLHIRPARTAHGWRTPVQGDGQGFPDCLLLRPPRLLVAELKVKHGKLGPEQKEWLNLFDACPCVEVCVWTPTEWFDGTIIRELQ